MPHVKLDSRTAGKLAAPRRRGMAFRYWDIKGPIPMFGVKVLRDASGHVRRWWILSYRNRRGVKRLIRLNEVTGNFGLSVARDRARDILADVRQGGDPIAEGRAARAQEKRAGFTVADLSEKFIERGASIKSRRRGRPWSDRTRHEFERILLKYVVEAGHGKVEAAALTTERIATLLGKISAPVMRNRVRAVLHLMYAWARRDPELRELVPTMPVFPDKLTDDPRRERVLTEDEIRMLWLGTDGRRSGAAFRLMLLTAQRSGEVFSARWDELSDEADGTWWTHSVKGGGTQRTPLTKQATGALSTVKRARSPWVFPSRTIAGEHTAAYAKPWAALGLGDATPHDLRRTAASLMARAGARDEIIKRVLGHALQGVTEATYIKHSFDEQKREALARLGDDVERILSRGAKVVVLRS
jgi:integrase